MTDHTPPTDAELAEDEHLTEAEIAARLEYYNPRYHGGSFELIDFEARVAAEAEIRRLREACADWRKQFGQAAQQYAALEAEIRRLREACADWRKQFGQAAQQYAALEARHERELEMVAETAAMLVLAHHHIIGGDAATILAKAIRDNAVKSAREGADGITVETFSKPEDGGPVPEEGA